MTKILSLKKIKFIILSIIIILSLFFFVSYLLLSNQSKENINDDSTEELRKTGAVITSPILPVPIIIV